MTLSNTPISCLPVSLFQDFFDRSMNILDWAAYAKELGMDYIDVNRRCLLDMTVAEAESISGQLAVPVMMITTYSDFTNPDPKALEEAVKAAKHDIALTAALKGKYLRLTAGQAYPDQDDAEMIDRIYRCFEACLPVAQAAGVGILLENHSKPGAWQYPDFDFHFERMLKLWEKMKDLPIGVNFDTANAYALENWRALVEAFGGRIETVHINELESITPLKFGCVGEGIVPQVEILQEVWKYGFHGPICIEEACMRGKEGIKTAFLNTKSILEELGSKLG
ncbi:MAG: sugar phosphate isomerase/epimerase [Ruminococcaceae bacterium]|nr:sugar phosphate isomerase/epimerase [Oscillospiraceae bacterium]